MVNAYFYANTAVQTTLDGNISNSATTCDVVSTVGWPTSFPFVIAIDFGAANEELVLVTNNVSDTLTITRAFGGTSAVAHSTGAVVRHAYNAVDATDFRTHEAATGGVHGVVGDFVGTTATQTLSNKTLTSPTINSGALTGTFTGTPTFSGAVVLSGTPNISAGAALAGTFTGTPTFSGNVAFTGSPSFTTGVPVFSNQALAQRGFATGATWRTSVTGDANDRFYIEAGGGHNWGSGAAAVDTNLYRSAADTLRTDDSFVVGGNLTVTGTGGHLFVRKTADTSRASTDVPAADPELFLSVAANAVYRLTGMLIYSGTTAGDLNVDFTVPASADGFWVGTGYGRGATDSVDGYTIRMNHNGVDQLRSFGATPGVNNGVLLTGIVRTAGTAGTYTLTWSQANPDATPTTLRTDSFLFLQRVG